MIGAYVLLCKNGRFYIGSTNNIARRLQEHKSGRSKYTKNLLPVSLVYFEKCDTLFLARNLERRIKKLKSHKLIEKMVREKI